MSPGVSIKYEEEIADLQSFSYERLDKFLEVKAKSQMVVGRDVKKNVKPKSVASNNSDGNNYNYRQQQAKGAS